MNNRTWLFAVLVSCAVPHERAYAETSVAVLKQPPTSSSNPSYVGSRQPLLARPLIKLPVGDVEPRGWLLETLNRQRAGMTGQLPEISAWLQKDGNAWLSADGRGKWGWEEVPYWLRGYLSLARQLNDLEMQKEATTWIEAVLASQRPDGNFGPLRYFGDDDSQDFWGNMLMLNCLQTYYEYSKDSRVLDLMSKFFRYQLQVPDDKLLTHYWQYYRGGDNLWSIYWLYDHTGETWLLELAERIHNNSANWSQNDDLPNWHVVNVAQAFGEPGVYYQQSHDVDDLAAAYRNFKMVRSRYGQAPGGMFGADENARVGYTDPRQAVETCGIVEQMRSDENLLAITGDVFWADHCEEIAFNALPAAYMPDYRALRFLSSPNLPRSDAADHAPGVANSGAMFAMNPLSHRCCQHNHTQGWPRFVEHLWMATLDGGLCATMYGPCRVQGKVGDGVAIEIDEVTNYPFSETVTFKIDVKQPASFPLYFRIPAWCKESTIKVGGESVAQNVAPSSFVRLLRQWQAGDTVTLQLPMEVKLRRWERNHNSVSIDRGPLTYSLNIGEEYVRRDPIETALQDSQWQAEVDVKKWPAYEVIPTSPWNYGLVLNDDGNGDSVEIVTRDWPANNDPFTGENVPISLKCKAKQIPGWSFDRTGLCSMLRDSPLYSNMPEETVSLIPMGAARLRITSFPEVRGDRNLPNWEPEVSKEMRYTASASYCNESDSVMAMNDGFEPCASSDRGIQRLSFMPHAGTTEWVQAEFDTPRMINQTSIYWCDDRYQFGHLPTGEFQTVQPALACRVPKRWKIFYRSGEEWKEVVATSAYSEHPNRYNTLEFEPVETTALRIEVQLAPRASAGVLEWLIPNQKVPAFAN